MKKLYGIDVGGTTVKMGLFSEDGELIEKWEIPTRTEENGKYILEDIAEAIKENIEKHQISKEDLAGVGVGVPGAVLDFTKRRYIGIIADSNRTFHSFG